MDKILLSINEAAGRVSLGRTKLYELIARGEIPTVRIGRAVRVPTSSLEEWARRQVAESGADRTSNPVGGRT